jgi:hypothetical protein
MTGWTKEEIMAYVDGQLDEAEIPRIEKIINKDENANAYYEALIESNELISIAYQQIENSYKPRSLQSKLSSSEKVQKEKSLPSKLSGALSISLTSGLGVIILGIIVFTFFYLSGQNSRSLLERNQTMDAYALKNVIENKSLIQQHIESNNLNDLQIQFDDQSTALLRFRERSIEKDKFCQKILVNHENVDYEINSCNDKSTNSTNKSWQFILEKN